MDGTNIFEGIDDVSLFWGEDIWGSGVIQPEIVPDPTGPQEINEMKR